jgi:hypothetical protein
MGSACADAVVLIVSTTTRTNHAHTKVDPCQALRTRLSVIESAPTSPDTAKPHPVTNAARLNDLASSRQIRAPEQTVLCAPRSQSRAARCRAIGRRWPNHEPPLRDMGIISFPRLRAAELSRDKSFRRVRLLGSELHQRQQRVATNAGIPASPVACRSGGCDGDETRDAGLAGVTIRARGPFRIRAARTIGGPCRPSGARSGDYGSRRRFSDGGPGNGPRDPEPLTERPDQRGMLIAVVNASGSVNTSKSSAQDYERSGLRTVRAGRDLAPRFLEPRPGLGRQPPDLAVDNNSRDLHISRVSPGI